MAQRVEIPAYTDRWMMGDRYGEVISSRTLKAKAGDGPCGEREGGSFLSYRVHLDKSGKTLRVWADDCREV